MIFDRDLLQSLVDDGWLRCQRHPTADLWIYNYTEKTQYENHWTPETLNCRGLILNDAGTVIARPFPKFFNYGTTQVPELPYEPFRVTEKIDGSLGILYYLDDEPFIASRGSFTSDQARVGTEIIKAREIERYHDATALFEIIYPENRIVVDYGARRDLVLLGCVDHETGLDVPAPFYDGPQVKTLGGVRVDELAALAEPNAEGFVVSFDSGLRVKVKFDEYVRLHRIVTGINARMIWEEMASGQFDIEALLIDLPDEIYAWIEKTQSEIQDAYNMILCECVSIYDRRPDGSRKDLAAYFLASDANTAVLFRMLDCKPYADLIWKAIKPEALTPNGATLNQAEAA